MNIDDLTIGQAKELAKQFGNQDVAPPSRHIGKMCIIRTYASGVHCGEIVSQNGRQIDLKNARRLWRWDVSPHGISLSEVATYGPVGAQSKICVALKEHTILDGLEIIPCSPEAEKVIDEAPVYTPNG